MNAFAVVALIADTFRFTVCVLQKKLLALTSPAIQWQSLKILSWTSTFYSVVLLHLAQVKRVWSQLQLFLGLLWVSDEVQVCLQGTLERTIVQQYVVSLASIASVIAP